MKDDELNTVSHTLVLDDALQTDLDDETKLQATRLHAIYLSLLDDLDVGKENLADKWIEVNGAVDNVVSIDDFRKEDSDDNSGKEQW